MEIKLHKLARTTPAIRKEIQGSDMVAKDLAKKYGVDISTIYKWRKRNDVNDRSHTRHNLLTKFKPEEEEVVKELRVRLGLSIDDITEVVHRCINADISRSAVYRCLKRLGVAKRAPNHAGEAAPKQFEERTTPGYIHMDVKHLTNLAGKRSYVYVAIDRVSRYVYVEILYDLKHQTSADFVERFIKHFNYKVDVIMTDNGFEWTDKASGGISVAPSGKHLVDVVCKKHNIRHKLIRIRRPQTNGMVERFNRRINEAIARKSKISANNGKNSFASHDERNKFILDFVQRYNYTQLPCLKYKAPIEIIKQFNRNNHTEVYTKAGTHLNAGSNTAI